MMACILAGAHQDILIVYDPGRLDENCCAKHFIEVVEPSVDGGQM